MNDYNIEKLDELIYEYTGKNKIILKKDITNLTKPGDNYFSLMLKIDITLKNLDNNEEEVLNVVAKCRNKTGGFFDKIAPVQFKLEIGFYSDIVPALEKFQREQGLTETINIFPKIYACRRNLHGNSDEIDEHAVILMENLILQGYSNIERQIGFNLEQSKHILRDIAQFHALPIALKLLQPDMFESTVKKYTSTKFDISALPKMEYKTPIWIKALQEFEECKIYTEKLEKQNKTSFEKKDFFNHPYTEPFASVIHNDLWVNNTMQKLENGKILENKLIDFQIIRYGNPLSDVLFFIYSSVQEQIVRDHLNDLIAVYQHHFFEILESLKCDKNLLEINFSEQVEMAAKAELEHILYMTIPIFGKQNESSVDTSADIQDMVKESSITQETKNRLVYVLTEFGKRGWFKE